MQIRDGSENGRAGKSFQIFRNRNNKLRESTEWAKRAKLYDCRELQDAEINTDS